MKMGYKWEQVEEGIRYREHATRLHGAVNPDRYFVIRYRVDEVDPSTGKLRRVRKEEPIGWESQNERRDTKGRKVSILDVARETLATLKAAHRSGKGPTTLEETRSQAAQAKADAERQRQLDEARNVTLAEYWPVYLTSAKLIKGGDKKPKSWQNDESAYRNWLEQFLGAVPIKDIDVDHWDRLMGAMDDAGLTPRTRQYVALVLRQVLAFAYSRKLVPSPPPQARDVGATLGKGGNRRTRKLSAEELQAILTALAERDQHAYAMTLFCALTGCRFGEAAGLEWKDLDFSVGSALFRDTKNNENRTVPLPKHLVDFLSDLRGQGRLAGHVFLNGAGKPYTQPPQPFRDTVADLGLNEGRAKRDRVVFHTLRHTAATRLANKGTTLPDLQKLCGWKSPVMALRYAEGVDETMRKAMDGLSDDLLKPSKVINLKN